jgi:tRNA threonylcarbamoyl adenosine modification protein (Sua5/YciO/YrdC/YwlC family)
MVAHYAVVPDRAFHVMKKVMPGPFTFILRARGTVPRAMHGKRREVGIRIPEHPIVQQIISSLGTPLLNVSAKAPEGHYLNEAREIEGLWGYKLDAVIDCGGMKAQGSTIVDFVDDEPVLIREGLGDFSMVLG